MAIKPAELTILHYPAPALRMRARSIGKIDDEVRAVAARMIDLMREAKGVGLAAPQVGLSWRLFVTEVPEDRAPKIYINPKLTNFGPELEIGEEGCLSLPGIQVEIERPNSVMLSALDLEGKEVTTQGHGFAARVWQHEFDHLNGVLIIDRLDPKERQSASRALKASKAGTFYSDAS